MYIPTKQAGILYLCLTHSTVAGADDGSLLDLDGVEPHTGVGIGQDIVVMILWLVVGEVGSAGKPWSHLNGVKFLQEELVVIRVDRGRFVHEVILWDRRVLL